MMTRMTEAQRRCVRCGQTKPVEEFRLRSGTQRRQSWCRACKVAYDREWYRRNRATHIAKVAVLRQQQRDRNSRILAQRKDVPCSDCGRRYPPHVMDFDHVNDDKVAAVAELARRPASERVLLDEIAKCEVVCANCHRERTYRRKERYRRRRRSAPEESAEGRARYRLLGARERGSPGTRTLNLELKRLLLCQLS
jgi:hypothetical protein